MPLRWNSPRWVPSESASPMVLPAEILRAKILIVDDLDVNIRLLERMLRLAGYQSIVSTKDSAGVAAMHRAERFDLILLDLQMPVMDGFQVMEGLKEIGGTDYLPVLVVSAQPDLKLRSLRAGAKDFVSKPFDMAEVLARVHNMLEVRLLHAESQLHGRDLERQVSELAEQKRALELRLHREAEEAAQAAPLVKFQPVRFGPFHLTCLLGAGSMGRVYRATKYGERGFVTTVALKVLGADVGEGSGSVEPDASQTALKLLASEARIGGLLIHSNLTRVTGFGQVEGRYFIEMDDVDGWTVADVQRHARASGGSLPESLVVDLLQDACAGLSFAHTARGHHGEELALVHRDLKPSNLMITRRGMLKVMDFGIARHQARSWATANGGTSGTISYMSPEQVEGSSLDGRSDLFALGAILYELCMGKLAFAGDNMAVIMHSILRVNGDARAADVAAHSPLLAPIVGRCLQRNREDRFPCAEAMEQALAEVGGALRGPRLREWLRGVRDELSAKKEDGDFGLDGPPHPWPPSRPAMLDVLAPYSASRDVAGAEQTQVSPHLGEGGRSRRGPPDT